MIDGERRDADNNTGKRGVEGKVLCRANNVRKLERIEGLEVRRVGGRILTGVWWWRRRSKATNRMVSLVERTETV